LNILMGDGNF